MPTKVFENSSNNSDNKIDTSLFVQKLYLRSSFIEGNLEEDIDLKNQYRFKSLPDPISITESCSERYVNNLFNDSTIIQNSTHIDLNDGNITNARFVQVNELPQINSHLTAKLYVDNAISDGVNEQSLLRIDPDEKLKRDTIIPISTLTLPKTKIELPTKNYVDNKINDHSILKNTDHVDFNDKNLHNVRCNKVNQMPAFVEHLTPKLYVDNAIHEIRGYVDKLYEIKRTRRDLSSVFIDQDNEFDNNKLTILDSVTVNREPSSEKELANKK